jgi:hypothetical protein
MTRSLGRTAFKVALLVALTLAFAASARAGIETLYDNDTHGMVPSPRATDRNYTFGAHANWYGRDDEMPRWVERVAHRIGGAGTTRRLSLSAGQELYTPDKLSTRHPILDDRPYAAWLYGGATIASVGEHELRALDVRAGIVGPSAQGEQVQTWWHRRNHIRLPRGWRWQLHDEPGLRASLDERWRPAGVQRHADIVPHVRLTAGNVLTEAAAGATVRLGLALPNDFGPGAPGGPDPNATRLRAYVFGRAEGRAVARDIFLDGNTFRSSMRVHRVPLVANAEVGADVRWHALGFRYTFSYTSQQFRERDDYQEYGSFALSF